MTGSSEKSVAITIEQKLSRIERKLESLEESLAIFRYGAQEIKKKHMEEYKQQGRLHEIDFQYKLFALVSQDENVSAGQKKIMNFMIRQFDFSKHQFKEMAFTQIKNALSLKVGKLSKHLNMLVDKRLLLKRQEGHRAYYKTNYKAYEEDNTAPDLTGTETAAAEQTA